MSLPKRWGLSEGQHLDWAALQNLTNCGDAIRIQSTGPGMHCLDDTIWFDRIINSRVGAYPGGFSLVLLSETCW